MHSFIVKIFQVLRPSRVSAGFTHGWGMARRQRRGGARIVNRTRRGVRPDLIEVAGMFQKLRILEHLPLVVLNLRRGTQLVRSQVEHHGLAMIRGIEAHPQRLIRNDEHRVARAGGFRVENHESRLTGLRVEQRRL